MKKIILSMVLLGSMAFAGYAQDDELFEDKKDTISIDDMDPVFFEAEEESAESCDSNMTVIIVAGVAVILAGAYFLLKKKKK